MNVSAIDNCNESFIVDNKNEGLKSMKKYHKYQNYWQFFRFFGSLSACLAIIPATISYEQSYYPDREFDTCSIIHENTFWFRALCCFLSFTGIFFELLYKYYYFRWIKTYPSTFIELPPPNIMSVVDVYDMLRKKKLKDYFTTKFTWLVILLYLVLPYPGLTIQIKIPQQIKYERVEICYYIEEFLYFIMFFRLFYLFLTVCAFGKFQGPMAVRICELHRVKLTSSFALRCYASVKPLFILAFLIVIPGIIVFGIGIRIFERPLRSQDLDSIENSMWLVVVTMTTVGYGDRVPVSLCARAIVCLAIFWGGINLSLTFVTLGSFLKLRVKESKAYRSILANRESGNIIKNHYIESLAKSEKLKGVNNFLFNLKKFFGIWGLVASPNTIHFRNYEKIQISFDKSSHTSDKIEKKLKRLLSSFRQRRSKTSICSLSST